MWGVLEQKYPGFFPKLLPAPAAAQVDPLDAGFEAQHQEADSESDEDVAVSEFAWEGRTYLRAADNVLYDPERKRRSVCGAKASSASSCRPAISTK